MSTRSGKRIHNSFHENTIKADLEDLVKSERKTRSRKLKENCTDVKVNAQTCKKRHNYVSYPSEEEANELTAVTTESDGKPSRGLRKNPLKEHNIITEPSDTVDSDVKKIARHTRRTKKFAEDDDKESPVEVSSTTPLLPDYEKPKGKKNKKNKSKTVNEPEPNNENVVDNGNKKSRKKKSKKSSEKNKMNRSNMSAESFHSAMDSPVSKDNGVAENTPQISSPKENINLDAIDDDKVNNTSIRRSQRSSVREASINKDNEKTSENRKSQRRSGINNITIEKDDTNIGVLDKSTNNLNSTLEKVKRNTKSHVESSEEEFQISSNHFSETNKINNTFEKTARESKSFIKQPEEEIQTSQFNKINTTFEKVLNSSKLSAVERTEIEISSSNSSEKKNLSIKFNSSLRNSSRKSIQLFPDDSFNASNKNEGSGRQSLNTTSNKLNSTFEKSTITRKRKSMQTSCEKLNETFEKPSKSPKLNSTFDKSDDKSIDSSDQNKETKLNTTFDKTSSEKSSLMTSDSTLNVTLDKSDEISKISITSDDSKTENIINTTPVLIESSLDSTAIEDNFTPEKIVKMTPQKAFTPLRREGTFTKDSPVALQSPKPRLSHLTPTKKRSFSLSSPGKTPFPSAKNTQKKRLNETHSIEKTSRRSSLANLPSRATKVMFCSPVDIPVATEKKKIIKSSMKGSNKSFVFDDSMLDARPGSRKRSYTHNDADDSRVKRTRLADDLQQSVNRLSRPRTSSATPTICPVTPKKTPTPAKLKSNSKTRTKLPNFAALHQKQFAKMESLDECQERKAKRAKQLLTPTASISVLDRISPKGTESKAAEQKSQSKEKQAAPNAATFGSLRPGFTRFGFKMNYEVNPFAAPKEKSKKEIKKPNRLAPTLPTPSLNGATSLRKEAAKQVVMREKSFTSLAGKRSNVRNENRTIIKGVRTNRRFDLQMKMRNINEG